MLEMYDQEYLVTTHIARSANTHTKKTFVAEAQHTAHAGEARNCRLASVFCFSFLLVLTFAARGSSLRDDLYLYTVPPQVEKGLLPKKRAV